MLYDGLSCMVRYLQVSRCSLSGWFGLPSRHCDQVPWRQHQILAVEDRVKKILSETPLIDGHNDFPLFIRYVYNNHIYAENFSVPFVEGTMPFHVDLGRLRAGQSGGLFWSVFASCPEDGMDFSDENYAPIVQFTLQQIDLVTRLLSAYPSSLSGPVNSTTALPAFRRGQLISPMGVEGLHQIGNSVANLRRFHALGARYATLTHNCANRYADAALWETPKLRKAPPYWGGLSDDGRRIVREMNRIGLMVDLAHTSEDTQVEVLTGRGSWNGSIAPVIYSHSSAHALCPHPRNVKDRVLRMVRDRRGLVMVNFSPDFVSCVASDAEDGLPTFYPPNATLEHVARHILHIGGAIGFDHVGIGSDFDGIPSTPTGLEDVSKFPDLVAELLRQGVSDEDAAKVVGGNLLRVWREVDEVALRMQAEGYEVYEDDLPSLKFPGLYAGV